MLTLDDCNSICNKYSTGFIYQLDVDKVITDGEGVYTREFITLEVADDNDYWVINAEIRNSFCGPIYFNNKEREIFDMDGYLRYTEESTYIRYWEVPKNQGIIVNIHILPNRPWDVEEASHLHRYRWAPLSPLNIPIINGEFDNKFYIVEVLGPIDPDRQTYFSIDGNEVAVKSDEHGKYLELPSSVKKCLIRLNVRQEGSGVEYNFLSVPVTFSEFKELPILFVSRLYRGTPQQIKLINNDTQEELTEFRAYYKGELLTDNKITLPYDADDYIDITVDLLDNRYPNSTLKLKAPTMMYIANSQSDVENAIANGITTLQVGDTETEVSLNGITLTNVQLVNSHIQLNNCTLTDCQLIQSTYTDNGANNITDTNFNECEITTTQVSTYNNCAVSECTVTDSELHITGTLNNNTFNNSLIVSDGEITITQNTFTGIGSKTYFPSHLYLTGDYIISSNTFNLTGEWETLQFNMCLIKTTTDFNISEFINKNTFNLNIEYGTENPSTLYYNIVDDDKIRARRI